MKKTTIALTLLMLSLVAAADQWTIYTEAGWKGVVYVNSGSGVVTDGWFINRQGAVCDILSGQSFTSNIRNSNISGAIGTTCGVWNVWKAKYAIPTIAGTTGNYGSPFGKLFTGKVTLN